MANLFTLQDSTITTFPRILPGRKAAHMMWTLSSSELTSFKADLSCIPRLFYRFYRYMQGMYKVCSAVQMFSSTAEHNVMQTGAQFRG